MTWVKSSDQLPYKNTTIQIGIEQDGDIHLSCLSYEYGSFWWDKNVIEGYYWRYAP